MREKPRASVQRRERPLLSWSRSLLLVEHLRLAGPARQLRRCAPLPVHDAVELVVRRQLLVQVERFDEDDAPAVQLLGEAVKRHDVAEPCAGGRERQAHVRHSDDVQHERAVQALVAVEDDESDDELAAESKDAGALRRRRLDGPWCRPRRLALVQEQQHGTGLRRRGDGQLFGDDEGAVRRGAARVRCDNVQDDGLHEGDELRVDRGRQHCLDENLARVGAVDDAKQRDVQRRHRRLLVQNGEAQLERCRGLPALVTEEEERNGVALVRDTPPQEAFPDGVELEDERRGDVVDAPKLDLLLRRRLLLLRRVLLRRRHLDLDEDVAMRGRREVRLDVGSDLVDGLQNSASEPVGPPVKHI
ncbi:hypothetical protein M885DRAFT_551927 [Pelagophyceae sp. CCMP2097]|nr:hypothetical protein M885DRAFT_551927 [Pelagophyceae sp. CCMP2097]